MYKLLAQKLGLRKLSVGSSCLSLPVSSGRVAIILPVHRGHMSGVLGDTWGVFQNEHLCR